MIVSLPISDHLPANPNKSLPEVPRIRSFPLPPIPPSILVSVVLSELEAKVFNTGLRESIPDRVKSVPSSEAVKSVIPNAVIAAVISERVALDSKVNT